MCGGRGWSLRNPAFEGRTEEQQREREEDTGAFSITEAGAFQGNEDVIQIRCFDELT